MRLRLLALGAAALVAALGAPTASAQEPGSATVVPIQITGPPSERLNLVIMGDGYQADEMDKFRADVDRNLNVQWSIEPFRSYRHYFNIYRLEIVSQDSGISCDPDDGNVRRNTPLRLNFANTCPAEPLARGVTYGPALTPGTGCPALNAPGCTGTQQQPLPVHLPDAARRLRAERPDARARQHLHVRRHRRHAGDHVRRQPAGAAHLHARTRSLAGPARGRIPVLVP